MCYNYYDMGEHTELRDSNRESMGITNVNQDVQFGFYNECAYENNPVVTLESLGLKGDVKKITTSFYYMGDENPVKGSEELKSFDKKGRIVEEKVIQYDIVDKTTFRKWLYESDKLTALEIDKDGVTFRIDYLYIGDIYVGKKIRKDGIISHFINYLYGKDVIVEERYGSNGKIETRTKRAYNDKGLKTEDSLSFNFYDNHHRYEFEYNEEGKLVKTQKWNCENKQTDLILYEYNNGTLIRTSNLLTQLCFDYVYKFDYENNWLEQKVMNKGKLQTLWKRKFVYFNE